MLVCVKPNSINYSHFIQNEKIVLKISTEMDSSITILVKSFFEISKFWPLPIFFWLRPCCGVMIIVLVGSRNFEECQNTITFYSLPERFFRNQRITKKNNNNKIELDY